MRNATAKKIRKLIGYHPSQDNEVLRRVYRRMKRDYKQGKLDLNNPLQSYET